MSMHLVLSFFALALVGLAAQAHAVEMIYDFRGADQADDWTLEDSRHSALELSTRFASPGTRSLRFSTAKWREGLHQWPAVNARFEPRNFSGHDRLVIEITNSTASASQLRLMLTDDRTPLREGFRANAIVPPLGRLHWEIDISATNPGQTRKIDLSRVTHLHLWTQKPTDDVSLYLDRVYLATTEQELPRADPALAWQLVAMLGESEGLKRGRGLLVTLDRWLKLATGDDRQWLEAVREGAMRQLDAVEATIAGGEELTDERRQELFVELDHLRRFSDRVESVRAFRGAYAEALAEGPAGNRGWGRIGVATASSMQKVLPRDVPLPGSLRPADRVTLQVARNEKEGFQVVVLPFLEPLRSVAVSAGELTNEGGDTLPADAVEVDVVGYVKTYLPQHPLGEFGQYVGWWPDPMLPFLKEVDVERGDAQAFFVRVRADKGAVAGTYRGEVKVTADGVPSPFTLELVVRVLDFTLPDRSPLPLAMTFAPAHNRRLAQAAEPGLSDPQWEQRWRTLKFKWADFLADYYISLDNIYATEPDWPDFEVLDHLEAQGRLDMINLGFFGPVHADDDRSVDAVVAEQLPRIRDAYERAKERGWLDRTYIYGFDERPQEDFPEMEKFVAKMREHLPGVKVVTTAGAYWGYWGEAAGIDIWCPILSNWDPERVEAVRERGEQAWWYVCIASPPPYPNVFIDQPVIDTRVMMGAMTAKYRPDGFLYYMTNSFHVPTRPYNHNESYIETGPFTTWNPKSFRESHGDGNLNYPGPGGEPLPNFRLENFRDGLEDFAYVRLLEQLVERVRGLERPTPTQRGWLRRAEAVLAVPEGVVRALDEFTRDPADVYAYRDKLADAITSAPLFGDDAAAAADGS